MAVGARTFRVVQQIPLSDELPDLIVDTELLVTRSMSSGSPM